MNKGVIVAFDHKTAHVLKNDGGFVALPKNPDWQIGDVVTIVILRRKLLKLAAIPAAAILAALLFIGIYSYGITTTFVEISVSPAVQLEINRFGRVLAVQGLNPRGEALIQGLSYRHDNFDQVFDHIMLRFANANYLTSDTNIRLAIADDSFARFLDYEQSIQEIIARNIAAGHYPQIDIIRFDLNEYRALDHPIPFRQPYEGQLDEGHPHEESPQDDHRPRHGPRHGQGQRRNRHHDH
jgi:hypothetical protein